MLSAIVIENFFDNFELLEPEFKKIPLYDFDSFPEKDENSVWPGKRSLQLGKTHPFIWQLTNKEIHKIIFYTKKILNKAIIAGGSSIKNFSSSDGKKGGFQKNFNTW